MVNTDTEQKLREKMVDILCPFYNCCSTRDTCGCFTKREHWILCISVERADQILALIKEALPEIAREAGYVKLADLSRKEFLRLPIEERRKILATQAQELIDNMADSQAKEDIKMMD